MGRLPLGAPPWDCNTPEKPGALPKLVPQGGGPAKEAGPSYREL